MPRSFLVKKSKSERSSSSSAAAVAVDLDDVYYSFTPSPVSPVTPSRVSPAPGPLISTGTLLSSPGGRGSPAPVSVSPVSEGISVSAVTPYTPTLLPLTVSTGYNDVGSPSLPETSYCSSSDGRGPSSSSSLDHVDVVDVDGESIDDVIRNHDDVIRNHDDAMRHMVHHGHHALHHAGTSQQPCRASPPVSDTCSDESMVEEHHHPLVEDSRQEMGSGGGGGPGGTIEYTYEAFFVTDGRSKKKKKAKEVVHGLDEDEPEDLRIDRIKGRYTCNECGKNYATSSNLSRHKQTHRSLDSQQAKKCPHCNKVYVSMPALSMHILTHELRHVCPTCNKSFSRPWLLQGHLRSHTGEKPYGCAHCGKAFADRSNLRAHMQTHSSFKHFECQRCHKTFALKSYLNKHYESACIKDGTE